MDDHRPSLRATMTTPRYYALMNDLSHLLWTPAQQEQWQEHHRFLRTPAGQTYYTDVVRELDDFREVLRKWHAEAEHAAKATD